MFFSDLRSPRQSYCGHTLSSIEHKASRPNTMNLECACGPPTSGQIPAAVHASWLGLTCPAPHDPHDLLVPHAACMAAWACSLTLLCLPQSENFCHDEL
jgi:hypothetical protein